MEPTSSHYLDWVFVLVVLLGGGMMWVRMNYTKRFSNLQTFALTGGYNTKAADMKEDYPSILSGVLYAVYISSLVLLIMGVLNWAQIINVTANSWRLFIQFFFLLSFFLFFRNLIVKVVSLLFDRQKAGDLWLDFLRKYRMGLGLWLVPMVVLAYYSGNYSNFFFGFSLVFLCAISVFHTLRATSQLHHQTRIPYYRIFLYLCTLEISPIIWAVILTISK
jgi:uncharacterized membrane protein